MTAKGQTEVAIGAGSVESDVVRLAWPAVGEQILNASVAIVDTFLVGHLGAVELTAVGLANQYILLATMLLTATAVGCTALIARSIGARDIPLARAALGQSMLLALLTGVMFAVGGYLFAPFFMTTLNAAPETLAPGSLFMRIVSLTMPLTALLFIGNACLRGAGDTTTPLRVMILVNGINIAVAWSLVGGFGPLPALGVTGVAIGAALARGVGGLLVLGALLSGTRGLTLEPGAIPLNWSVMQRILRVGVPATLETLILRVGQLIFAATIASLGTIAYAAHVLVLNIEALSYMPGAGFATAATTVVGQRLGARQPDEATRGAYYAFFVGGGVMSITGLLLMLFPEPVIRVFTSDLAVIEMATPVMRVAGTLQPGIAATMIFYGALRGAGDTRWPLLTNSLGLWLVRVLGGYTVVHILGGSLVQVWALLFLDFVVRGGTAFLRFRSGRWQSIRI